MAHALEDGGIVGELDPGAVLRSAVTNIQNRPEEHGRRVLKVRGKGGKVVLTPLPPVGVGSTMQGNTSGRAHRERFRSPVGDTGEPDRNFDKEPP